MSVNNDSRLDSPPRYITIVIHDNTVVIIKRAGRHRTNLNEEANSFERTCSQLTHGLFREERHEVWSEGLRDGEQRMAPSGRDFSASSSSAERLLFYDPPPYYILEGGERSSTGGAV